MRIAWFTPLSARSAIAEYSLWVTAALAETADVELWVPGTADAREAELPIRDFVAAPELLHRVGDYDVRFYNLGNHERFHGAIYDAAQRHPGVVVLHDRVLHHFFFEYWLNGGRRDLYFDALERHYGSWPRRAAEESFAGIRDPVWEDSDEVARLPLFEEAVARMRGAVTHSLSHAAAVEERWFGPVAPLFLPAYPPADGDPASVPRELRPDGRTTVLTVGHVNANKQVDRVVEAIADRGLADRARYVVVGPYDQRSSYAARLQELVDRRGLTGTVFLTGYQSDDVVGALVRSADLLVNLRYPSFEGGSASLMQGLALGKPTLVYDSASFGELPDGTVYKVSPNDARALADGLETLVTDPEVRAELGANGAAAAAERSPTRYARDLLEFADEVRYWDPATFLCDRVSEELALLAVPPTLPAVDAIAHDTSLILADAPPRLRDAAVLRALEPADERALARFFARNDIPEVVANFDPFPFTPDTARRITRGPTRDRYYGAFLGGRLVALSMLRGWDEGYDVPSFGIAVDAALHGSGIGSTLTRWTVDQASALGCSRVRLSVYGRNTVAYGIYERLGFMEVERTPVERTDGPDERIVMMKELD